MTLCTLLLRYAPCAVALLIAAGAGAQSLNVDLDVFFGDPSNGNGAPSSSFGGAALSPGYWNRVHAGSPGPDPLFDLTGQMTNVVYTVPVGSGSGGGSNYPINTGDYALLLNDYANIPDLMIVRFTGMRPGAYRIYTYAVDAGGRSIPALVTIPGSSTPTQMVTGPMPGNALILGITHCVHELELTSDTIEIQLRNQVTGPPNASVNGFQILAVPEPASVLACLAGVGWILKGSLVAFAARSEGT